jgi:proline-specific peptidase
MEIRSEEGFVPLENGHKIWYQRLAGGMDGIDDATPLLLLHGGPGAGHDYLENLAQLATVRPVIFYDQLGCGKSDQPDDRSLWTIERSAQEIDELRAHLGLDSIHLLGQSYGGFLAIEYLLSKPAGVETAILSNTAASVPQFVAETRRLREELPADVQATLTKYEATGDFHHPDYEAALAVFNEKHLLRLPVAPEFVLRSFENLIDNVVYETMFGPNDLVAVGNLKDWDRIDQLDKISLPTLVAVGRHDELTPACAETIHAGIAGSELVIFEESSHLPHIEEEERYLSVVSEFLAKA